MDRIEPPSISDEEAHAYDDACDDPECPTHGQGTDTLADEPPFISLEDAARSVVDTYLDEDSTADQLTFAIGVLAGVLSRQQKEKP